MISTERIYAHIDKEALVIVFTIKQLFGYNFWIFTDDKPLQGLLHYSQLMYYVCQVRVPPHKQNPDPNAGIKGGQGF